MLIRYVTPWPWPWKFVVHQASRDQSRYEIWTKLRNRGWIIDNFANFCTRFVVLWLDLWPLALKILQHFVCRVFKLCTKFERHRRIHGWVIDDLARFRRAVLGVGTFTERFSRVRGPKFTKLGGGIGDHFYTGNLFHRSDILLQFKRGWLKVEQCWKRRQISHFLTSVKITGGVGEISISVVEALSTTEPPKYIWWPSTARLLSAVYW